MNRPVSSSILLWTKGILLFFLAIWVVLAWRVNPSDYIEPAQGNAAVMAATYGIAAAISLFIPLARPSLVTSASTIVDSDHQLVDGIARGLGAIATAIAAGYWLASTIEGSMGPFLVPIVAGFGLITLSAVAAPLVSSLRDWKRDRRVRQAKPDRQESRDDSDPTGPALAPLIGVLATVAIAVVVIAWKRDGGKEQRPTPPS